MRLISSAQALQRTEKSHYGGGGSRSDYIAAFSRRPAETIRDIYPPAHLIFKFPLWGD